MPSLKFLGLIGLFFLISSCSSNKNNGAEAVPEIPTDTGAPTFTITPVPTMTPTYTATPTLEAENDWLNRPNFMAGVDYQVIKLGSDRLMAFDRSGDPN